MPLKQSFGGKLSRRTQQSAFRGRIAFVPTGIPSLRVFSIVSLFFVIPFLARFLRLAFQSLLGGAIVEKFTFFFRFRDSIESCDKSVFGRFRPFKYFLFFFSESFQVACKKLVNHGNRRKRGRSGVVFYGGPGSGDERKRRGRLYGKP